MSFTEWLRHRTGWPASSSDGALPAPPPSWRRAVATAIVLLLAVQVITGVALMTVYSPSVTTAWASVWYVQTQVPSGWLVRGLHYFASDALVVLFALYLVVAILTRAYLAPREFVWWTALCLMGLVVALAHTGYLLPWDQDGYWGTSVRLNILARAPIVGPLAQRLLSGGNELGHGTLTRFYTLHVVVLPAAMALLGWIGFRCRKRAVPVGTNHSEPFGWRQSTRHAFVGAVSLMMVFALAGYAHHGMGLDWLDAPADPAGADYPARPEWYFLFLFQWLTYFSGPTQELIGAIVIPGAVVAVMFALPLIVRARVSKVGHAAAVAWTMGLILAFVGLTGIAMVADGKPAEKQLAEARAKQRNGAPLTAHEAQAWRAADFHANRRMARKDAQRAIELANAQGIPPDGPLTLLANDPMTTGPRLFSRHCASCHRYHGHDGQMQVPPTAPASSDLGGYATAAWLRGFLEDPMADHYFGLMKNQNGEPAHTKMKSWLARNRGEGDGVASKAFQDKLDAVVTYLEDESLHPGRLAGEAPPTPADTAGQLVTRGRQVFLDTCNECHSYDGERTGTTRAPEMRGYGSVEWLELMISNPSHDSRYRDKGREPAQMPSFADQLSRHQIRLIATWLHDSRDMDDPGS